MAHLPELGAAESLDASPRVELGDIRTCIVCDALISQEKRRHAIFCSPACRTAHYREKSLRRAGKLHENVTSGAVMARLEQIRALLLDARRPFWERWWS